MLSSVGGVGPQSDAQVFLSLGSNLGDRRGNIEAALDSLASWPGIRLARSSHCYETEPYGNIDQPLFLNAAAEIWTELAPMELLNVAKEIETRLGRVPSTHWGPRAIDIDIVLWGGTRLETTRLTLPHAEFRKRAFVLVPLAEIAPEAVDPVTGKTVAELAGSPDAVGRVTKSD